MTILRTTREKWKYLEPVRAAQLEQSDSLRNSVNPKWSELFVFLTDCVFKQSLVVIFPSSSIVFL